MHVLPYLYFNGRCEEAFGFYRRALGAEITALLRFKESPEPHPPGALPPGHEDKVMHGELRIGESTLFASDGDRQGPSAFEGISLTIATDDVAQTDRFFAALSDGGQVRLPPTQTFFSPRFAMVTDRFGVGWLLMTKQAGA
jgi:PhnB protein